MNKIYLSLLLGLLGYLGNFCAWKMMCGQIVIWYNWVIVIPLLLLFLMYRIKNNYLTAFSVVSLSLNNLFYIVFSTLLYHMNQELFMFNLHLDKQMALAFFHQFMMQYLIIAAVELLLNRSFFQVGFQSHYRKVHKIVRKLEEGFIIFILLLFLAVVMGYVQLEKPVLPPNSLKLNVKMVFSVVVVILSFSIAREVYRNTNAWKKGITVFFNNVGSRYFSLFENLNAVYYESTFDGIILEVSEGIKDLYGYEAVNLKGRQLCDFYEEPKNREKMLDLLRKNGEIKDYKIKLKDNMGQIHYASIHAKVDQDIEGKSRIIGVIKDITGEKRREDKQKSTEEKYKHIFNNLMDIYYEMNCYGELLEISPSVETSLGYSREELLGTNALSLCSMTALMEKEFKRIFEKKTATNREVTIRSKNGENRFFLVSMSFVMDVSGKHKISGIARDITEFMKMKMLQEESESRYKRLFENTLNGVIILEPLYDARNNISEVRFLDCNPSFEKITGLQADYSNGKTWYEIFGYQNRYLETYKTVLKTGIPKTDENYNPVLKKHFRIEIFRLSENQIGGVFEDITKQKLFEQEILELNKALEERVEERTRSLQMAMRDLEAFIFSVSHDLKSPLRIINIYSKIFIEEHGAGQPENALDMIVKIKSRSEDMISMVDKLLFYVKDSKQEMIYNEVNMEELVKGTLQEIVLSQPERTIHLEMPQEIPSIIGDYILLKRVVDNILSNAVKFTQIREVTVIKVKAIIQEHEIIYSFSDNGIGLDMKESGKVFGLFQRLNTERIYEGTGIGMAVILKMVQRHKGRVWIEGEPDVGMTIFIALPNRKEETIQKMEDTDV